MLIHIVSRPLSELSHVPRSGVRSLVRTVRDAGAEVVEDVGLTGDFSHAVATCAEQLQRQWENKPPQIVHTVGLVATMAALAARRDGLPVVSTFDESPVPSEVEARLARQVDAVIPLSTPEQDVWRQLGAHTASPGVIALAQPAVDAPARTGEDVVCLCSGDELSRVVDSMPYWGNNRLVILGRVSDDRWAQLIQQARALGVEQRLVRRPGLRGEQRQAMWRDAALLLAGTEGARHGGFVLEAAAHGVPSVAVAVEAHLDHIVPGATGLLSNPAPGPARWAQSCPSCSPTTCGGAEWEPPRWCVCALSTSSPLLASGCWGSTVSTPAWCRSRRRSSLGSPRKAVPSRSSTCRWHANWPTVTRVGVSASTT